MAKALLVGLVGFVLGLAASTLFLSAPGPQTAQLDSLPAPYYTVLWENEDIRLVEHRLEPGQSEGMHYHPHMVAYFLENSTVRVIESDGTTSEPTLIKGTVVEVGPWTHEIENVGRTPLHSLIVEFKRSAD